MSDKALAHSTAATQYCCVDSTTATTTATTTSKQKNRDNPGRLVGPAHTYLLSTAACLGGPQSASRGLSSALAGVSSSNILPWESYAFRAPAEQGVENDDTGRDQKKGGSLGIRRLVSMCAYIRLSAQLNFGRQNRSEKTRSETSRPDTVVTSLALSAENLAWFGMPGGVRSRPPSRSRYIVTLRSK